MKAGELKHRVTIMPGPSGQDTAGEPTPDQNQANQRITWAKIAPLTGQERMTAQQEVSTISHEITIRYMSNVKPSMHVLYGTRRFEINVPINVDEADRELRLLCTELIL